MSSSSKKPSEAEITQQASVIECIRIETLTNACIHSITSTRMNCSSWHKRLASWNPRSKNTSKHRRVVMQPIRFIRLICHLSRLVIDSISPLEPDRKCFRMVGGVLVERTVKEVLPALQTNYNGVCVPLPSPLSRTSTYLICFIIDSTSYPIIIAILQTQGTRISRIPKEAQYPNGHQIVRQLFNKPGFRMQILSIYIYVCGCIYRERGVMGSID